MVKASEFSFRYNSREKLLMFERSVNIGDSSDVQEQEMAHILLVSNFMDEVGWIIKKERKVDRHK